MKSAKITIGTVSFNAKSYTQNFVDSVLDSVEIPYELIIVDNCSTDGTVEYLKQLSANHNIKVIFNSENQGFGQAHNKAFSYCKSSYYCCINNDVLVPKGFFEKAYYTIRQNKSYKQLGASEVSSMSKIHSSPVKTFTPSIETLSCPQNYVNGSFFIVEKEAVHRSGYLFDKVFDFGFCEDVDLSWRLGLLNFRVGFVRNLEFVHFGNTSFDENKDTIPEKRDIYISNTLKFYDKWNDVIKSEISKQLKLGVEVADVEIIRTKFKDRNYFRTANRQDFTDGLIKCLDERGALLTDLIRKYYK